VSAAQRRDRRLPRAIAVASGLTMVAAGAIAVLSRWEPSHANAPTAVEHVTSSARHRFGDLPALVGASDLVVVGRVAGDEDGRLFGAGGRRDLAIRSHVLTIQVERVLMGSAERPDPGTVVLVEEEHSLADGTPVVVDGMRPGRSGDRGLWFLAAGGDPDVPAFAVVNAQGRYLFLGDRLVGGDRSDPLVRRLESAGAEGVERALRAGQG
jgi:hypothetical protein